MSDAGRDELAATLAAARAAKASGERYAYHPIPADVRPALRAHVRRLYDDPRLSLAEISERVGYARSTVRRLLAEGGAPARVRQAPRRRHSPM